jgi:hypothetical protein
MRCKHLQCFSYSSYVFLNKNKRRVESQYVCPICNAACSKSKLFVDPIVDYLLTKYPGQDHVYVYNSGWFSLSSHSVAEKSIQRSSSSAFHKEPIIIDLVDDDDDKEGAVNETQVLSSSASSSVTAATDQHLESKQRISVATLHSDFTRVLGEKYLHPAAVHSIEAIARVRLSDVLFFINNAPKDAIMKMLSGKNHMKPEQLYDRVVSEILSFEFSVPFLTSPTFSALG